MVVQKKKTNDSSSSWLKNILFVFLLLFFISVMIYLIVSQVNEYYAQMDPMLHRLKDHLSPLHPRVDSLQFFEGNKSYTINKQKVYLCLRDENKEYYDFNMLVYVSIHELAHVVCDEVGHTKKFHEIFDRLLKKAAKMGIYDPRKPIIQNYCGHT